MKCGIFWAAEMCTASVWTSDQINTPANRKQHCMSVHPGSGGSVTVTSLPALHPCSPAARCRQDWTWRRWPPELVICCYSPEASRVSDLQTERNICKTGLSQQTQSAQQVIIHEKHWQTCDIVLSSAVRYRFLLVTKRMNAGWATLSHRLPRRRVKHPSKS